jgi:sugar phosphate isomerase/epimerase
MNEFGLTSTALRSRRFTDKDIANAAAAGFTSIALAATAGHIDLSDVAHLDLLVRAANAEGVVIRSLSVPVEGLAGAVPIALERGWPLVVGRLGPCRLTGAPAGDSVAIAPLLEKAAELLPARGCALAVQVPGGRLISAESVVSVLESLDDARLGVCLDVGHAQLTGAASEAAEVLSGLVMTTLLHDNNGRDDLHRAPGEGTVNWAAVLTACWKTGFTGPWVIDVAEEPGRVDTLTRAVGARTRLQAILEDLAQPMTFTE